MKLFTFFFCLIMLFGLSGVIYASGNASGDIWMSGGGIHQHMIFKVSDAGQNSFKDAGQVKYWNFDYPQIMDYTAEVVCSTVIGREARFMFKVPGGWPGFSGLYIVSYVKDNGRQDIEGDLYEHMGTMDYITAKEWCETGTGYSPTGYMLTYGNLSVR